MREASTQNASESLAHLLIGSIRLGIQHGFCREDDTAQAEPALGRAFVDESLLQRVRFLRSSKPLRCGDFILPDGAYRHSAGTHNLAAHDHCAGAALGHPAAKLGTAETEFVGQNEQQWRCWVHVDGVHLTIHFKRDGEHSYSFARNVNPNQILLDAATPMELLLVTRIRVREPLSWPIVVNALHDRLPW